MKNILLNLLHFIILILCFMIVFCLRSFLDYVPYLASFMVILWILFLVAWQIIFNRILKYNVREKRSLIISISEIIVNAGIVIGGYYLIIYLHNKFLPNEDYWTNLVYLYDKGNLKKIALEFLNYVYMVENLKIPVTSIVITNSIVNVVVVIFAKIVVFVEFKNTKKFVLEKILKFYFVCSLIVSIIIALCLVPGSYIFILIVRPLFICLGIVITIIYLFLMSRALKYVKENSSNKNLIIVQDVYNFEYSVMAGMHNVMKKFSNSDVSKNPIIYGVNTENAFIVSNDVIRNNIINVNDYEKVSYYVDFTYTNIQQVLYKNEKIVERFLQHIENLEKEKKKVVVSSDSAHVNEELIYEVSKICGSDFYVGMDVSYVIEELLKKKDNEKLKENIDNMIKFLQETGFDKNKFTSFIYNELYNLNTTDSVKSFHTLMKICEYMIQYRALVNICKNKETMSSDYLTNNSFGDWNNAQENIKIKIENKEDIKEACNNIAYKLSYRPIDIKTKDIQSVSDIKYKPICSMLVTVRNRTIGHGNITYDISDEIVADISVITKLILKCFIEKFEELTEEDNFGNLLKVKNITVYKENETDKLVFIYNYGKELENDKGEAYVTIYEYLNYDTGKIICEGGKNKSPYRLNIRDNDKEIKLSKEEKEKARKHNK